MIGHRLDEQENMNSLPAIQFANLAQHEQPLTCSCTETPLKSFFTKVTTLSSLQYRGRRIKKIKKKIRKGNEISKKEQSNQNTLAVSPEGLVERGCILQTPGNPCPGMASGRLPVPSAPLAGMLLLPIPTSQSLMK